MSRQTEASLSTTSPPVRALIASTEKRLRNADTALAIELLAGEGCPACGFVNSREDKFFLWFALESYIDFGTIDRLDAALGMCPRHCRTLIRSRAYPGTLTHIYGHVVRAALRRLRESSDDGECIACEHQNWAAEHAIAVVGKALSEESVAASYRSAKGFCASHLLQAIGVGTPEKAGLLLDEFLDRLGGGSPSPNAVQMFVGSDPDAEARATLLQELPEDPLDVAERGDVSTRDRLRGSLRAESCPICLAAGQAGRRYLRWIGSERQRRSDDFGREVVELCPTHLADLARLDPQSADWLGCEKVSLWRGLIIRFRRQALSGEPRSLIARLRARSRSLSSREEARRSRTEVLAEFLRETLTPRRHWREAVRRLAIQLPPCGVCHAEKTAADRTTALLLVSSKDASLRPLYEASHGLCVRHVLGLPRTDRDVPLSVCRVRLDLLAWELDEAARKQSWSVRYENRGDETNAWRRAMAQIDGRVFLGG